MAKNPAKLINGALDFIGGLSSETIGKHKGLTKLMNRVEKSSSELSSYNFSNTDVKTINSYYRKHGQEFARARREQSDPMLEAMSGNTAPIESARAEKAAEEARIAKEQHDAAMAAKLSEGTEQGYTPGSRSMSKLPSGQRGHKTTMKDHQYDQKLQEVQKINAQRHSEALQKEKAENVYGAANQDLDDLHFNGNTPTASPAGSPGGGASPSSAAASSGGSGFDVERAIARRQQGKNLSRPQKEAMSSALQQHKNISAEIEKAGGDSAQVDSILEKYGVKRRAGNTASQDLHRHTAHRSSNPNVADYAFAYKVPQAAVGAAVVGGALSLTGDGGRKTNAELYSNPF